MAEVTKAGEPQARAVFHNLEPLVLASASPRRRDLLHSVGLAFDIVVSGVEEETGGSEESPDALVKRWAGEKALAVSRLHPNRWVLGADTIVVLDSVIFGKPAGSAEAASMLRRLSGRTHDVISGVCLMHHNRRFTQTHSVSTRVRFKRFGEEEIQAYVNTGEPMDKAGAYGIQGVGAFLVESVDGSYTNVVGLPLCETLQWLIEQRVIAPAASGRMAKNH